LNWYINVGEHNRSWVVETGFILKNGEFVSVARSKSLIMPRYGISEITDEFWGTLKVNFEKLIKKIVVLQISL
jgi:hypothetical protein